MSACVDIEQDDTLWDGASELSGADDRVLPVRGAHDRNDAAIDIGGLARALNPMTQLAVADSSTAAGGAAWLAARGRETASSTVDRLRGPSAPFRPRLTNFKCWARSLSERRPISEGRLWT
jgi:hypothetical protein